jgi:antitoxin component YwqK of YwqJK toxin-antitoxin module
MKKIIIPLLFIFLYVNIIKAQEVKEGFTKFYYPNGQISSEGNMRNGQPDGYWKTYYVTGVLKSEGLRRNFELDSTWLFYNQSGELIQKINYKYGKKNGYSTTYNYNTNTEGTIGSKELYVNDKKEGTAFYYYDNGRLKETVNYKNGKKEGESKEYDQNGVLITLMQYHNNFVINREMINRYNSNNEKIGKWIEFYPDGRIQKEMNYEKGLLNGLLKEYDKNGNLALVLKYENGKILEKSVDSQEQDLLNVKREFNENGNLIFSGSYKEDVPVGIHRFYNDEGIVINSFIYDDFGRKVSEGIVDLEGNMEGSWKNFYSSGELRSEGNFMNNRRTGKWLFYYKNGIREQEGSYLRGFPDGYWKWYYDDGSLLREESYFNGREDGEMIEYDKDGNIIAKGDFINGEKEGDWYYAVADHKELGSYQTGLRSGKWEFYYTNGILKFEGEFSQGLPNGKHKYYYEDGELEEERFYEMGIREKNWKKYDENGNIIMTIMYKNDTEFRINGQKVNLPKGSVTVIK